MLAVNDREGREAASALRRELGLELTILLDSRGETAQLYRVNSLPTTFFVDGAGVLEESHVGSLDFADLLRRL